jgi:ribosome maturation factor RimP
MEYPGNLATVAQQLDALMQRENLHLVQVKLGTGSRIPLVRMMVDLEDRFINIDDCSGLSKQIEKILDRAGCFPKGYRLEVSSPGLSHPLREPWEFRKHLDRRLKMYYQHHGEMKEVEGRLVEIAANALTLHTGNLELNIPFDELDHALSVIDWQKSRPRKAR